MKFVDTDPIIGKGSKLERHWKSQGFQLFYKKFRAGKAPNVPEELILDQGHLLRMYNLRAVGFGNWVTQEDRYNYSAALILAFYDLNQILKFNNNIGLNKTVSISFGARGVRGALAHFEPHSFIINITRYKRVAELPKEKLFLYSGGAGSVAHEYGHALDYYFGLFDTKEKLALTGGSTVRTKKLSISQDPLFVLMDSVLNKIIYKDEQKGLFSAYYEKLKRRTTDDYYIQRNEIFARVFERYIQLKLKENKIHNSFLTDTKYDNFLYLTESDMRPVMKDMDLLISEMRTRLKAKRIAN